MDVALSKSKYHPRLPTLMVGFSPRIPVQLAARVIRNQGTIYLLQSAQTGGAHKNLSARNALSKSDICNKIDKKKLLFIYYYLCWHVNVFLWMVVTSFGTCQHTCIKGIDEEILAKFQIALAPSALSFTKSAALFSKAAMSTSDVAVLEDADNDQLDLNAVLQDSVKMKMLKAIMASQQIKLIVSSLLAAGFKIRGQRNMEYSKY